MRSLEMARHGWRLTRSLRRFVNDPVPVAVARAAIVDERRRRAPRFLTALDRLVWPFPSSPTRRLLDHAGLEPGDVRRLVDDRGLEGALVALRDAGVYVSYEEHQGKVPVRRGSTGFDAGPADFFNPVVAADYMAATGGSRSSGTPVELSFAYQRRQGTLRAVQLEAYGVLGKPTAVWLPVFPSAAGFGAIVKLAAGGNRPERWFSQIPPAVEGITPHKRLANRMMPALHKVGRTGLPSAEHAATEDPSTVVAWMRDAVARAGGGVIVGYASSIAAAARHAIETSVDLTGIVAYPSSEPVTAGKLELMRAAGIRPCPMYAFVPEGIMATACPCSSDEEYHLWDHEVAVVTRPRTTADGTEVDAFLWTSLSLEAPRVLVNVENDDFGRVTHDDPACPCPIGDVGVRGWVRDVRGLSKVVAAGISLPGDLFDHMVDVALPARLGGGPGDYQFVEGDEGGRTIVSLRVHPRVGAVEAAAAEAAISEALRASDNGVLAAEVWGPGSVRIVREAPLVTRAGKTLSYERRTPAQAAALGNGER